MAVSALSAAKTICELRDWNISNLALQKILYVAHMYHLGSHGAPLIDQGFQAWDYGPVVPSVYQKARGFGSGPIPNVFHWIDAVPTGTPEYETLAQISEATKKFTPGQLVSISHWPNGAWAEVYRPGELGIRISDERILAEYNARIASDTE